MQTVAPNDTAEPLCQGRLLQERQAQVLAGVTGEQVAAALGDLVSPVDVGALTGDFAA